jgi:Tfp pilus assembly protein PilF
MLFSVLLVTFVLGGPEPAGQAEPTFAQAVQAAADGNEEEALAMFQQLAAQNPHDHAARLWIGRLHQRMGHPNLAEAVYRSILLETPDNVDAMLGVAIALLARNETAEALELLETAEGLSPENERVLATLGRAHQKAGRPERAIAYFERAVSHDPSAQHRLWLERARLSFLHRVETHAFSEQFSGTTSDTQSADLLINLRMNDAYRVVARGHVQRKLGVSEQRGGGGLEWRWKSMTTLRGQVLLGPDNRVMPEGDYLGELEYVRGGSTWLATARYFDFTGARTSVFSPSVSWLVSERLAVRVLGAVSWTDANTLAGRENGYTGHVAGTYQLYPRVSVHAGYTRGVDDFEAFSIDRIGNFLAHTVSGGVRVELPSLTAVAGTYEYQDRTGDVRMSRFRVSFAQRF